MLSIATVEPTRVTVGDRWLWERQDLTDYPAPDWTLSYSLVAAGVSISIAAIASGTYHRVDLAPEVTALYAPGRYDWHAYVAQAGDRRTVGAGAIELLPNFASQPTGYDARTFAKQMLDAIESAMLGKATRQELDMVGAQCADRGLQLNADSLSKLREIFRAEVKQETMPAGGGRLLVRL